MTPEQWLRVEPKVCPEPMSGCWLWGGAMIPQGYGVCRVGGRSMVAHRAVYEHYRGPVPAGLDLDHVCRVRACVNPDHLRPATRRENVMAPGSLCLTKRHAQTTHCPRGHAYEGGNVWRTRDGRRRCRSCVISQNVASNRRRRARAALA